MQRAIIIVLVALTAVVALAEGQYYVPRAYYTIDTEGHASAPVPLRRLRRSYNNAVPLPYGNGGDATANANAWAQGGGDATANANARTGYGAGGGWGAPPRGVYGSSNPALRAGQEVRQAGPVVGRSVTASSSVGLDATGNGYYDNAASVYR